MSSPARLPLGRENYGAMPAFEPFCNLTGHEPTGQNSGMRTLLATLFLSLSGLGRRLDRIEHQLERVIQMSETADTAFAELSAKVDTLGAAITQFGADVQAEIAGLSSGPLNATQQAAKDALSAKIDGLISTVGTLDAGTKPAPAA